MITAATPPIAPRIGAIDFFGDEDPVDVLEDGVAEKLSLFVMSG